MKARHIILGPTLILIALLFPLAGVSAGSGLPDSPEFGYGARLDLWGQQVTPALNVAAGMGMDWMALDFDWGRLWAEVNVPPDLTSMTHAVNLAGQGNMFVMISITNAPAWALTPNGPDPDLTAGLVISLARLYPDRLLAIELFPGANTVKGWGATPDPQSYALMLQKTNTAVRELSLPITIISAGLTPLAGEHDRADMDDLRFLEGLYKNGAAGVMPVVSVRLPEVTGDPMFVSPNGDRRFLRHYEEVRMAMLNNNHQTGLIWVTAFSWPDGSIDAADSAYTKAEEQAAWVNRAYRLMRAQLYIGVAFFGRLNPPGAGTIQNDLPQASLVQPDGSLHGASEVISKLISFNGNVKSVIFHGNISKKTPDKLTLKPSQP